MNRKIKENARKIKVEGISALMGIRVFEGELWMPLKNVQRLLELIVEVL